MPMTLKKSREIMLVLEQQRRSRQAHRDELELAYADSRPSNPRPLTLQESDLEHVLVPVHVYRHTLARR